MTIFKSSKFKGIKWRELEIIMLLGKTWTEFQGFGGNFRIMRSRQKFTYIASVMISFNCSQVHLDF